VTGNVESRIRLAVDIGGTFTDVVLECHGRRYISKVLTTSRAPDDGVMQGVDDVLARSGREVADLDLVLHGTTLATNAIIERKGANTGLVTTEGFRDVLEIGYESRYDQYDIMDDRKNKSPLERSAQVSRRLCAAPGEDRSCLDSYPLRRCGQRLTTHQGAARHAWSLVAYAGSIQSSEIPSARLNCDICD